MKQKQNRIRPIHPNSLANLKPPFQKGCKGNPGGVTRKRLVPSDRLFEGTGLDFAVAIYRDPAYPIELRLDAAMRAAKFQVPALSASLTATVEAKEAHSSHLNADQRRKRINELLAAMKLPLIPSPKEDKPSATIEGTVVETTDQSAKSNGHTDSA